MFKVKCSDGKSYSVGVSLDMFVLPRFKCPPPNTVYSTPIAVISRGENFHGELVSSFHVVFDNDFDPQYMVLWEGDNGSQAQDDQARLNAGAWTKLSQFYNEEEGFYDELRAQQVLLYAFVRAAHDAWDHYEDGFDSEGGDNLSDEAVEAVVQDALAGRPLQVLSQSEESGEQPQDDTTKSEGFRPMSAQEMVSRLSNISFMRRRGKDWCQAADEKIRKALASSPKSKAKKKKSSAKSKGSKAKTKAGKKKAKKAPTKPTRKTTRSSRSKKK